MWPIFRTKMLAYLSNANLDVHYLVGEHTHILDCEIRKMLVRGLHGNEHSMCASGQ